jgi:hypothetical protein
MRPMAEASRVRSRATAEKDCPNVSLAEDELGVAFATAGAVLSGSARARREFDRCAPASLSHSGDGGWFSLARPSLDLAPGIREKHCARWRRAAWLPGTAAARLAVRTSGYGDD